MRFLYFYLMADAPDGVRATTPEHAAYWRNLPLRHYQGGPFADRQGGMVVFDADSLSEADRLAADDPFRRRDLIDQYWLKEWLVA